MDGMHDLEKFIVKAKANGWVGSRKDGKKIKPTRLGSSDIIYESCGYHYHDSFVGFSDFSGMEHVALMGEPVWSMSYYGYLLKPEAFTGQDAVKILTEALGKMYDEGRFLGGYLFKKGDVEYRDMNFGDYKRFNGVEKIFLKGELVYELLYIGGIVRK